MAKKAYYIPTIEIILLQPEVVMDGFGGLSGSGSMGQAGVAPQRRTPAF
jgi:hypothetical protein